MIYFIDHGAYVNATYYSNETPLHIALKKGYKDNVEYLVSHGADVNSIRYMIQIC